jgi:hypothetical protein
MNEAMAFINCPKVSVEARFLPPITVDTKGFSDVCIRALPIPRSENEISINMKLSPKIGNKSDTAVIISESNTVFFLPILFISMPVGTEKMRNQKNTSDGNMFATESLKHKSFFTKLDAMPTRSTNPIAKKQSITGTRDNLIVFFIVGL